jgi:hypothetical protein
MLYFNGSSLHSFNSLPCLVEWITLLKSSNSKVHPRTGHDGPEEYRYTCSLSLTLALDGSGWSMPHTCHFTPGERGPLPIIQEAGWSPGPV